LPKSLVTGGAGFIGSHIVDRLVEAGHTVSIIDNLSTGRRANINPAARFHEDDVRDGERVLAVFREEKPDYVFHLAAQMDVRKSVVDPVYDAQCNILGSLNLIEAARQVGARKLVYASTGGAVYGEPRELPVKETHPIDPMCPYGATKHTVEHYLFMYRANYGIDYTVLRYPNIYGPRQDPHGEAGVVAIFSQLMLAGKQPKVFGDGSQTRDYVFVSDVVDANVLAIDGGSGGIFNLGTGVETSVTDVFRTVAAAVGYTGEPLFAEERLGEIHRICLDASLIGKTLGWTPKHTFEQGVAKAVAYYREQAGQ